ncbi:hypothetical protein T459_21694 [Capsicum annuum]|uniref:DNA helicase Pif1-like 2B domain-containing protein n=1 Tax=Capsicum annuum TaxID=4072 RepID=A0A2G2YXD1_CAPAN|nr:hypothetical protein T459_21694 [Capsicum annuum]
MDTLMLLCEVQKVTILERILELTILCSHLHQWEERLMFLSINRVVQEHSNCLARIVIKLQVLPPEGSYPKFSQLYIYDTENKVANRIHAVSNGQNVDKLHAEIDVDLKQMLDGHNVLAKTFRMVRDRFQEDRSSNIKLILIGKRHTDRRRYNLPMISEVAALVVRNFELDRCDRDIIIKIWSESTYPDFLSHSNGIDYLQQREILAPTLDMVESVNEYVISLNHNLEKIYLSSDMICMSDNAFTAFDQVHTLEFLSNIKCSEIPNHAINLEVGVPVMLLRNINPSTGLCNGTRLIITRLED